MSATKTTPGTWGIAPRPVGGSYPIVTNDPRLPHARIGWINDDDEYGEANARLVVAAKDLLVAVRYMLHESRNAIHPKDAEMLEAVLAKATSENP